MKSTLGNWEQGTRTPDPWDIKGLAELYGARASYLMFPEESQLVITQDEEKLLRNWRALPENERDETARRLEVQALRYRTAAPDQVRTTPKGADVVEMQQRRRPRNSQ